MRKLVWFSVGFAVASLAGAVLYGGWLILAASVTLVTTIVLFAWYKRTEKCRIPMVVALGCTLGLLWFGIYDYVFVLIPRVADGQIHSVTIEATDYSYISDYSSSVEGNVVLNGKEYRVKAYLNGKEEICPGDSVTGTFRFRLTTDGGKENPTHHRCEGIFLLAYPKGSAQIDRAESISWEHYPAIWRRDILDQIHRIFPEEAGGFASALLLGDRTGISYETDTAFKTSGISHVIAVSGLHVSILFGLIYTLLARKRVLSCLIGIPILFLFAAIAGFTPSITRACIMQSLMLLALLFDKEYDGPTALAFAVLTMLVFNPLTILSISFQLSVSCMMGIFLFSEKIRQYLLNYGNKRISKDRKYLNRIWKSTVSSVSISFSATIMTTPLVAYHFGCVSVVSVLTNLLTLWVISFVFYGVIFCLLVSLVSMGFAKILGGIIAIPIHFVLKTAGLISDLPMSAGYTSSPYVVAWIIGTYILLGIYLLRKIKKPKVLILSILFSFLLSQAFAWFEPMMDDFRMTMIDVGQGQSVLLQSDGKTFLVDCGGDSDKEAADATAEMLLSQGICRLDGVIVTHYDADHAGGVEYLLSRIRTDRLILPDVEDSSGLADTWSAISDCPVEYVTEDMLYSFGDSEMTIFAPISRESDNENSICILFQREDCGILITGDRGIVGETALLEKHRLPEVNVLVAGHHGSAGSTSQALLDVVSPDAVFISVGVDNRYGHPANAVLERLAESGCLIYRTDIHGTIIFRR